MPFPPGARNKKAPERFLSGRTSAMIEAFVKGGRFVNGVFAFQAKACAKIPLGKDGNFGQMGARRQIDIDDAAQPLPSEQKGRVPR